MSNASVGPKQAVQKIVLRAAPPNARTIRMGDEVAVHYIGRLQTNGYIFDSSRERGREFVLLLGAGGVIQGWELGLQQMQVGEVAKLICVPELAYGKKGMPDKVPPNATLEFEIEVLSACRPILKDTLIETDSNVCPKEEDYVRVHMVVKGVDGVVRDDYFAQRPLEFYMKDHVAKSESDGKWRAGNLLKKLVEQMTLNEKASFHVEEEVEDKYGNKPFWASKSKDTGVVIELELKVTGKDEDLSGDGGVVIGKDEDLSGDGGVVKHKIREGEGYEKATDGALLYFLYRIMSGPHLGGRIRETGDVVERIPASVEKALADGEKAEGERKSEVLFESWDAANPCGIICGFGETAEGLEDALVSMKKNEHASVAIAPAYGFVAHDGGAPCDGLPATETLHYEILLLSINKGLEHWNLDLDAKRLHGERKRQRGNDFFRRANYRRALKLYDPIVAKMGYFMRMPKRPSAAAAASAEQGQLLAKAGQSITNIANSLESDDSAQTPEERELKKELQTPTFLNIAACRSKIGQHRGSIEACNAALALDDGNIKALYRRAVAHICLCNYEQARTDLEVVLKSDATNVDARRELQRIHKLEEQAKAKQRKAFGTLFRSHPPPPSDATDAEAGASKPDSDASSAGSSSCNSDLPPGAQVTHFDVQQQLDAARDSDRPRTITTKITRYPLRKPDVAPVVRIAGMYGGGGGSDGSGGEGDD